MTQTVVHPHLSHRRAVSSSSAHASRPSTTRASRPPSHRKGASSVNLSIAKLGAGSARTSARELGAARQPEMAASFLNFCATCENQITVPDNYLLYCSESCRRKDSRKPLSASLPTTASMTTTPPGSPPMSPRTIVPPMTPTKLARPTAGLRIPSDFHDAETDLDPTEWKPVIAQRPSSSSVSSAASASSEAWQYLARFHGGRDEPPAAWTPGHRSLASVSTLGASPSLTDTVSVASSCSSSHSGASDDMSAVHRPLPPRHNPSFSGGGSATKGVELVMPHVDPAMVGVAPTTLTDGGSGGEGGGLWEKSRVPIITIAPVCCEMSHTQ